MEIFIEPIGKLINEFSKLPGVGQKTAQRYAYKIIDMPEAEARAFADAIIGVKRKVTRSPSISASLSPKDVVHGMLMRSLSGTRKPRTYRTMTFCNLCGVMDGRKPKL